MLHEQTQNKYKVTDLTHATVGYKFKERKLWWSVTINCHKKVGIMKTRSHNSMQPFIPISRAWYYN